MLLLFIAILFLVYAFIGYKIDNRLFSPYTVVSITWGVLLLFYFISSPPYYDVENRFPLSILLWVSGFYISSLLFYIYTNSETVYCNTYNEQVGITLTAISVPTVFYFAYLMISTAITQPELFFINLRVASVGLDDSLELPSIGPLAYFLSGSFALYLVCLYRFPENKILFFIVLIANILFAFVLMSTSMFIQLLLVSFIIKFFSKRIKIKSIIFVFSGLLLLFYLIHFLRESDFEIMSYFQAYFFSGIVAFDNVPITINWEGDNVFRFFYAIAHAINPNIPVSEPIFDYCVISNTGHMTNVYTGLYPFYSDFGYAGIGVFSVLWGSLAGYLYKKAFVSIPFLLLYSILIVYVSLMFFGDFLCANFSLSLQYILLILLLFIPYKFKLEKFSLL